MNVAKTFGGVEHRIELVRTLDGVKYYNSSIDSSPNRTINTLRVFPNKVIMIAGGKDKGIPYDEIGPALAEHVKVLILIGATSDKIQEALDAEINKTGNGKDIEVIRATSMRMQLIQQEVRHMTVTLFFCHRQVQVLICSETLKKEEIYSRK